MRKNKKKKMKKKEKKETKKKKWRIKSNLLLTILCILLE